MKQAFLLLLVVLYTNCLFAANSPIVGEWHIQYIYNGKDKMYDRNDPKCIIRYGIKMLKKAKADYTSADSMRAAQAYTNAQTFIGKAYMKFTAGGDFIGYQPEADNPDKPLDKGKYDYNERTGLVNIMTGKDTGPEHITIKDKIMSVEIMDQGQHIHIEYRKYK